MAEDEPEITNIRDPSLLGPFIGCTLVDVTQDDKEDLTPEQNRVYLHFSNGATVSFPIGGEGFEIEAIDDV